MGICPSEIEKLEPMSKGINDKTIAKAAKIVPSTQIFVVDERIKKLLLQNLYNSQRRSG
jgi:hypothetical protein